MSTSAKALRFDDFKMWVDLSDGRTLGVPLAWFPRLLNAKPEQRAACEIGQYGLHWDALDEDISIEELLAGRGDIAADHTVYTLDSVRLNSFKEEGLAYQERTGREWDDPTVTIREAFARTEMISPEVGVRFKADIHNTGFDGEIRDPFKP